MSNQYFRTRYTCVQDCRSEGCPSHEMVLHIAHTSETVSIIVDRERRAVFGDSAWDAVLRLAEQRPEDAFSHEDEDFFYIAPAK